MPEALRPDLMELVAAQRLGWAKAYVLGGDRDKAKELLKTCQTSEYRARKLWWSFRAALPRGLTRACLVFKDRIVNRCAGAACSVFRSAGGMFRGSGGGTR